MNVYDFDKTIYDGDSTTHFYFYCLKKRPRILIHLPATAWAFIKYRLGRASKTQFKETMYRFLRCLPDTDALVEAFWKGHEKGIKAWYKEHKKPTDVIISASPEFLLEGVCQRLGVECMMASVVDKNTGKYTGENCHGKEKVRRFYERYPEGKIEEFYSDSRADTPLAEIAQKAFLVKGERLENW